MNNELIRRDIAVAFTKLKEAEDRIIDISIILENLQRQLITPEDNVESMAEIQQEQPEEENDLLKEISEEEQELQELPELELEEPKKKAAKKKEEPKTKIDTSKRDEFTIKNAISALQKGKDSILLTELLEKVSIREDEKENQRRIFEIIEKLINEGELEEPGVGRIRLTE